MTVKVIDLENLKDYQLIHVGRKNNYRYEALVKVRGQEYGAFGKTKTQAVEALSRLLKRTMYHNMLEAKALDKVSKSLDLKTKKAK